MKTFNKFTPIFLCSLFDQADATVDENNNGASDIWEQKYSASALVADPEMRAKDSDYDGCPNILEAHAGTDPLDPFSSPKINILSIEGNSVSVRYPTEIGKRYRMFVSSTLGANASWRGIGSAELASTTSKTVVLTDQTLGTAFYRLEITDEDSDIDGLTDWEEQQLDGFDPQNRNSFAGEEHDAAVVAAQQQQRNSLTISQSGGDAYEKENTNSKFIITRANASAAPLTVFYDLSGHSDPSKGSASTDDYVLKDSNGDVLPSGFICIPGGMNSVEIIVDPKLDTEQEVPETLTCTLTNTNKSAAIRICDAENTKANRRLFVARLNPVSGTKSTGSGVAAMLLRGDNEVGFVTMSFSGLEGVQTGAHIQYANVDTQTNLDSLPGGQLSNHPCALSAAQFLSTDQQVLEALLLGSILVNVESDKNINGDIRGVFVPSSGSEVFVAPAPAPAVESLTNGDLDRDIIRFLTQSTFGATPESFHALKTMVANHGGDRMAAFSAYIDSNLGLNSVTPIPSPSLEVMVYAADAQEKYLASIEGSPDYKAYYNHGRHNRRRSWWTMTQGAQDQIRQRAGFALSEIFVVSGGESVINNRQYGMANYYDMLNAGASGTYRDLIGNISRHPVMGQYLSALRNAKSDGVVSPDENYAREIMQLFSIGLVHLHEDGSLKLSSAGLPVPTYDQDDISELARVFTGWSFSVLNSLNRSSTIVPNTNFNYNLGRAYTYQDQWTNPMKNFSAYHDTDAKDMPTLGLAISSGGTGDQDLDKVLDYLGKYDSPKAPYTNHQTTAPFIIRRLIQRLVTSNPSNGYIYRVTQIWKNTNGHLGQVIKAILLDYEARSLQPTLAASYGKKKEPIIHVSAIMRALGTRSEIPLADLADTTNLTAYAYSPTKYAMITGELAKFPAGTTRFRMGNTDSSIGQTPLQAPSVFNYFLPDYSPSGSVSTNGVKAPEFQIATEVNAINHINVIPALFSTHGRSGSEVPNQNEANPAHNPYHYGKYADHMQPNRDPASSHFIQKYLAIMDTNGDNKVNDLDTTFNQPVFLYAATAALVDELDLYLSAGTIKNRFEAGYNYKTPRANNPRDQIIEAVAKTYQFYDDDGVSDPEHANFSTHEKRQLTILTQRLKYAVYLIGSSPYGMIQR